MSLLPIIYSSILIFSGILVFVVILSYVSFIVKGETEYISGENENEVISEPRIKQQKNVFEKEAENILQIKKIDAAPEEPKNNYEIKTGKYDKKNISVLYKKKDIFKSSRPKFKEPRFSVIKDLSEYLVKNESNVEIENASCQTVHVMEAGSVDYLKFYENY